MWICCTLKSYRAALCSSVPLCNQSKNSFSEAAFVSIYANARLGELCNHNCFDSLLHWR